MRNFKNGIERIKDAGMELGWYCACLLTVLIMEKFDA